MSSDVVIRADGLGKKYVIGHQAAERTPTFRDAIVRNVRNFARTTKDLVGGRALISGDEIEEFWALKDVSFEIKRGDVVGIIGRNGAGKSTLLKVLSRITEPSEGRVEIQGRVASLLEVGTGFHPELTGRENIYLNGAILGMTREEIRRKFDEIVDFSGVEKFLDTPVKRYSSGMYVRLAFAVAAHLEPEILIVDEVLAVGDTEFQKKCLGKMQDVAGHGRTVLFVSHNMGAISSLCKTGLLLSRGRSESYAHVADALRNYAQPTNERQDGRTGNGNLSTTTVNVKGIQYLQIELDDIPTSTDPCEILASISTSGTLVGSAILGGIGSNGVTLSHSATTRLLLDISTLATGDYEISVRIMSVMRPAQPITLWSSFSTQMSTHQGETDNFKLRWGLGPIRLNATIDPNH